MDIVEVMRKRYSCKQFEPNRVLSKAQLEAIEELLLLAPSSTNLQPWHFTLVQSKIAKHKVASACMQDYPTNVSKITDSCITVVFSYKTSLNEEYLVRLKNKETTDGRFVDQKSMVLAHESRVMFASLHNEIYNDFEFWAEKQLYINLGSFLLGIACLGLDSICIEGIDTNILDKKLELNNKGYRSSFVVSIGFHAKSDPNLNVPKSRFNKNEIIERM